MAVDFTDYPRTDEYGIVWLNPGVYVASTEGLCFWCKQPTYLVDIDWGGFYCGKDDKAIEEDLRSYAENPGL